LLHGQRDRGPDGGQLLLEEGRAESGAEEGLQECVRAGLGSGAGQFAVEDRLLRLLKTVGAILLVSAVLYTAVDLTYGYLKHRPADGEALNLHPSGAPADENQSYVTVAFSREVQTQPGEWDRIPGQKLATPSEYHGQYFNVDRLEPTGNLYRRTINP